MAKASLHRARVGYARNTVDEEIRRHLRNARRRRRRLTGTAEARRVHRGDQNVGKSKSPGGGKKWAHVRATARESVQLFRAVVRGKKAILQRTYRTHAFRTACTFGTFFAVSIRRKWRATLIPTVTGVRFLGFPSAPVRFPLFQLSPFVRTVPVFVSRGGEPTVGFFTTTG